MTNRRYKIIRAEFLLPISDKIGRDARIKDGYVLLENEKILEVGKYGKEIGKRIIKEYGKDLQIIGNNKKKNLKETDITCLHGVILPGFVKAHGHDHESPIIGMAKDVPLTAWLDEAVNTFTGFMHENSEALKKKIGKSPYLVTYLKARLDDIHYGITSSLVHHCNFNKYHVKEIVEANTKAGTKIIIAVGSQDRNYDERVLDKPHTVAVKRLDKYSKEFSKTGRVSIIPGPDQFFSNSPELLKAQKKWAKDYNTLIHIHSSEEPKMTEWFTEKYGMTPVEYGQSIGFLDGNTILAHQVNCTENDLAIIKKTRAKVVHNPLANAILGSGMPPVKNMIDMGIPFVISTDGSGSSDNQNILNAARVASQYQKALHKNARLLPAQRLLEMITVDAANMLRLNVGSLEPGKDGDVIVIDISKPNMTPTRMDNVVENLIWASDGSEVMYVIANGRVLMDNYRVLTLDEEAIKKDVTVLSELFMEYLKTGKSY